MGTFLDLRSPLQTFADLLNPFNHEGLRRDDPDTSGL